MQAIRLAVCWPLELRSQIPASAKSQTIVDGGLLRVLLFKRGCGTCVGVSVVVSVVVVFLLTENGFFPFFLFFP